LIGAFGLNSRSVKIFVSLGALISVVATLLWLMQPTTTFYLTGGWIITVGVLLWLGNRQLANAFDKILPWKTWGNFRFFLHLLSGLAFLLILMNLSYLGLKLMLTTDPPTLDQLLVTNVYGAFIFIPVFSIYFSLHFLRHWRKSELDVERIQKENMRSQLTLLQSKLDPHFLFNNLNILSALMDADIEKSKVFIDKFADVYRGLLQRADDLTPLSQELEFIDSYLFLLRTRFEDHIIVTQNIKGSGKSAMIPPLTLQLLVENAVKHNTVSDSHPLTIQFLQIEDDYLIVSNTLNQNDYSENREGSGLKNIQGRYAYFTDKPVKIVKSNSHFEVHIPLLEIQHS
jgi:hypothetical protein